MDSSHSPSKHDTVKRRKIYSAGLKSKIKFAKSPKAADQNVVDKRSYGISKMEDKSPTDTKRNENTERKTTTFSEQKTDVDLVSNNVIAYN